MEKSLTEQAAGVKHYLEEIARRRRQPAAAAAPISASVPGSGTDEGV